MGGRGGGVLRSHLAPGQALRALVSSLPAWKDSFPFLPSQSSLLV